MSLLDTASLIVTPNGYKEGKLYSVIPSDGSGDLSVTRATTATRVNSAGLVELVPYNLFTYSSSFSNAAWAKVNSTVTGGQNGYDGTTNAFLITDNSTSGVHLIGQTPVVSGQHTISIYAKADSLNWIWLRGVQSSANVRAWFNLSTGTIGTVETNGTANIESIGNGWYRCSLTIANHESGFEFYYGVSNADNTTSYVGSGQSIFVQDAQLVEGSAVKDYQKTETRLNIPRLDYSNGTCPSILVEPQRTNLVTYSSSFDNSDWLKTNSATITANQTTAPDGTLTADRLNTASSGSYIFSVQTAFSLSNNTYSHSVYAKAGTQSVFTLGFGTPIGQWFATFNLTTASVTATGGSTATGTIEDAGNGWYRCVLTATLPVLTYCENQIGFTSASGNMFIWGAQVELGSYPTSYIPTTSASVTRNADVISKTGISSLIGQTEGTIFLDFVLKNPLSATNRIISITESVWNTGGSIRLDIDYNKFTADFVNGGSNIGNIGYFTTVQPNTRYKVAIAYKENDCQMYINGVDAGSDTTTAAMPTCSELYLNALGGGFNAPYEASNINAAALWKTRLTNTQLAQLTTI